MKVRYRKGVATRPGPESCGGAREGVGEALTGETAGQPLSREIGKSGAPTPLSYAEGNTEDGAIREPSEGSTRSKTLSMRGNPSYRNWEIPPVPGADTGVGACRGRPMAASPAFTWREVGCLHSTDERTEQGRRIQIGACGGAGGKAGSQGERRAAPRAPDSEPDKRVDGAGRVREAAERSKEARFTALMHHITPDAADRELQTLEARRGSGH